MAQQQALTLQQLAQQRAAALSQTTYQPPPGFAQKLGQLSASAFQPVNIRQPPPPKFIRGTSPGMAPPAGTNPVVPQSQSPDLGTLLRLLKGQ
jgi:hypothetical protein